MQIEHWSSAWKRNTIDTMAALGVEIAIKSLPSVLTQFRWHYCATNIGV